MVPVAHMYGLTWFILRLRLGDLWWVEMWLAWYWWQGCRGVQSALWCPHLIWPCPWQFWFSGVEDGFCIFWLCHVEAVEGLLPCFGFGSQWQCRSMDQGGVWFYGWIVCEGVGVITMTLATCAIWNNNCVIITYICKVGGVWNVCCWLSSDKGIDKKLCVYYLHGKFKYENLNSKYEQV